MSGNVMTHYQLQPPTDTYKRVCIPDSAKKIVITKEPQSIIRFSTSPDK